MQFKFLEQSLIQSLQYETVTLYNKIFIAFVVMWDKYRYGRISVTATATLMMLPRNKCSSNFWRAGWHKVAIMKLLHSIYLSNKIFITFEVPSQRQKRYWRFTKIYAISVSVSGAEFGRKSPLWNCYTLLNCQMKKKDMHLWPCQSNTDKVEVPSRRRQC